jgi:hypothetical protein
MTFSSQAKYTNRVSASASEVSANFCEWRVLRG